MVRRQARAEATRQKIIEAGVDLFGGIGYGETDMIDVIQHANTTKGTCYYYFPTKTSLVDAIIAQSDDRIAGVTADVCASDAPAMHRLITATFEFAALTESDPVVRVGHQLRQALRQVSEAGVAGFGETAAVVTTALRHAVEDGHVRADVHPQEAAHSLFAGLIGVRLLADAVRDDPIARLEWLWRTFLPSVATDTELPALTRFVRSAARKHRRSQPQPAASTATALAHR